MRSLLLISIIMFSMGAFCQSDSVRLNSVYFEISGPGTYKSMMLGSINYEHRIKSKESYFINGRIGLGLIEIMDSKDKFNPDFTVPFGITTGFYILKKKFGRLSFVPGVGFLYASIVEPGKLLQPTRKNSLNLFFDIGVLFDLKNGIMIKAAYTPIISHQSEWINKVGVSIGYSF